MPIVDEIPSRFFYSPAETERLLGISHTTCYRLIAAGKLDARKLGGKTLITGLRRSEAAVGRVSAVGLSEFKLDGTPALRISYFDATGAEAAVRFRVSLESKNRFRWRNGLRTFLYGLNRLADARTGGYVILVEGESDCHALWWHNLPALGLPGNPNWNEERDASLLVEIPVIYVVIEPGQSGDGMLRWLSRSLIAPRCGSR